MLFRSLGTCDVDGFIEAVRMMQRDPELRRAMGQRGRLAFIEQFSAAACGKQWRELIEAVGSTGDISRVERHVEPVKFNDPSRDKPQRLAV